MLMTQNVDYNKTQTSNAFQCGCVRVEVKRRIEIRLRQEYRDNFQVCKQTYNKGQGGPPSPASASSKLIITAMAASSFPSPT